MYTRETLRCLKRRREHFDFPCLVRSGSFYVCTLITWTAKKTCRKKDEEEEDVKKKEEKKEEEKEEEKEEKKKEEEEEEEEGAMCGSGRTKERRFGGALNSREPDKRADRGGARGEFKF